MPAATNGVFYAGFRVTAQTASLMDAQNEIDVGLAPNTLLPLPSSRTEPHFGSGAAATTTTDPKPGMPCLRLAPLLRLPHARPAAQS